MMNFAVKNGIRRSYICAGQESHCQMYFVTPHVVTEDEIKEDESNKAKITPVTERLHENGIRRRGVASEAAAHPPNGFRTSSVQDLNGNLKIRFDIKPADSIQTDFQTTEPLQRVVRISPNGQLMATGGTDGHLRLWTFPKMTKKSEIK